MEDSVYSFCKREARKSQKWVENWHEWGMEVRGWDYLEVMFKGNKGQGWCVAVRCIVQTAKKQVIKLEERMPKATVAYLFNLVLSLQDCIPWYLGKE